MTVEFREIITDDKTGAVERKPTHLRVSSATIRIDEDEPLIVGAVEAGILETKDLPPDADKNPRSGTFFISAGTASVVLKGADLEAVLPAATRIAIREAMIAAAKANGALEKIIA